MSRNQIIALPLALLLIVSTIVAACANAGSEPVARFESDFAAAEPEFEAAVASDTGPTQASIEGSAVQATQQQALIQERLIIRTGNLAVVVADTDESLDQIGRLVEELDGWVVSSDFHQTDGAKAGSLTVRVPAERYDEAVARIKDSAMEVRTESSNSQDVTEEYVDLSARLESLEATADRVRTFLDEARNVEEALAVNQELSRLESDIESLKGRLQYLSQSAAFSTLTIHITPDELSQPIEVAGWQPQGAARTALETLIAALQGIADVVIWLAIFCLPLIIIFGIPGYFLFRFAYRRWQKRRSELTREEE